MYEIDSQLMVAIRSYVTTILSVVSALVVNLGVSPAFTIGMIPLMFYYAAQQKFFTVCFFDSIVSYGIILELVI